MHSWTLDEEASQPFFSSRYRFPWQQPSLVGPSDELGSGTEIQLPQDVVDVCLHRPGRDVEPGGDLAVGHSSGDQLGNLRFATGQPLPRWPPVAWPIVQPRRQRLIQGQLSAVGEQPCGGGARRGAGLSQPLGQAALQRLRYGDLVDLPVRLGESGEPQRHPRFARTRRKPRQPKLADKDAEAVADLHQGRQRRAQCRSRARDVRSWLPLGVIDGGKNAG